MRSRTVCLINPPTSRDQDPLFFPMGPLVLATLLRREGIPVRLVDFDFLFREEPALRDDRQAFDRRVLQILGETGAEVFGISSICSNFPYALELAELIRSRWPAAKIIMGGPQPSSVPEATLRTYPAVDAIVIGEGERTLLELLSSDWTETSLRQVPGMAIRTASGVERTSPRPLIEDLDELPMPDFSLLNIRHYLKLTPTLALIEAGRGCPFACNFCSTATFWSRKYRAKSPARILEEMTQLNKSLGMTCFNLTHDNFTTSPKYVRKFCEYFIANNRQGFTWSSSARTDSLLRCNPKLMRDAGCRYLFFGVDTGSPRLQEIIDKHLDLEEFKAVLRQTVELGIEATVSLILGYPEETRDELNQTIMLGCWSRDAGAGEVQFHRLSPLAGTKLFEEHKEELLYEGVASDFSYPIAFQEKTLDDIRNHPKIFSSYFVAPTPALSPLNLFLFSQFHYVLLKSLGKTFSRVFDRGKQNPVSLFEAWEGYFHEHFPDESSPTADRILQSYLDFI